MHGGAWKPGSGRPRLWIRVPPGSARAADVGAVPKTHWAQSSRAAPVVPTVCFGMELPLPRAAGPKNTPWRRGDLPRREHLDEDTGVLGSTQTGPASGLGSQERREYCFSPHKSNCSPLQMCTGLINEVLIFLERGASLISLCQPGSGTRQQLAAKTRCPWCFVGCPSIIFVPLPVGLATSFRRVPAGQP